MKINLVYENDIRSSIEPCRNSLFRKLKQLLPQSEIEEIGSTAIPGSITKGDLDILVLVNEPDFESSVEILTNTFEVNEIEPIPYFASFKGELENVEFGVQLSTACKKNWQFIEFRNLLRQSPELVSRYNEVKISAASLTMEQYREKKNEFIESVLKKMT